MKVWDTELIGVVVSSSTIRIKRFERDNVPATNVNFMIGLQGILKVSQNIKSDLAKSSPLFKQRL